MNFNVSRQLVHDFREAIGPVNVTVSQALRLHMAQTVADARERAAA